MTKRKAAREGRFSFARKAKAKMRLYGRIEKVETQDDGTVKVHGVASTETIDDQGEIVTADAMRAAIPDYLKYPALREMHQLQAAGKTLELDVGDDKVTRIVGHVVDPVAVKKIRADVYRGFSIGGKVTQRDPANHKTITGLRLDEISLVDRPANPGAVIEMWKAAIAAPMRDAAAGVWRCFDPDHAHRSAATAQSCMAKAAKAAEVMRMPDGLNTIPLQIWHCGNAEHRHLAKADAAKCMVDQTAAKAGGERAANADPDPARAALDAARRAIDGADAAIGKKSDDASDKPYGDVAYADPGYQSDGKKRYPIDTEAHIRAAWSFINRPKNSGKYTSEQVSHIKSKIVAAWKSKIDKEGPPSADDSGKAAGVALTKTLYDAADLAEVIQRLRIIVQGLQLEAAMEGDDSETPSKVQAVIDAACEALVALVAEETGEIKSGDEVPPEMVALAVRLGGADALVKAITPMDLADAEKARYEAFAAALAEAVAKAGAKHSAADQAMLDLGYHACVKCAGMDGLGKAAQDHMNDAAESFKAAGAGEIDDNPVAGETHETPTEESTADTGRNPTHAAPMQTPPAAEYHSQNSTVDTRDNARTQTPQVDPGGTGRGSNIDHIATALMIGSLAKRHGGHQMLMDVAHDCAMKLGGADAMCGAAKALTAEDLEKAGARHSAETMGHLKTAHDHIVAAGGVCSKVDAHNAIPGGDVTGEPEGEGQGTVTMPGGGKAASIGDLAKVLEANGSLIKAVTDLAGRLDASAAEIGELRKRIEEVRAEPVPPSAAKRGLTLPEGIHRIEKTTPMTTVTAPPPDPSTMTDEQLIALFQKMSAEEQGLLLTKAALRRPLHAQTGQPLG